MGFEHWQDQYQSLKAALEDAYAEPTWDSDRIDVIAAELAQVERQLSASPSADL